MVVTLILILPSKTSQNGNCVLFKWAVTAFWLCRAVYSRSSYTRLAQHTIWPVVPCSGVAPRAAHYLAGGAMLRGRASRSTLSGRWCHAPGSRLAQHTIWPVVPCSGVAPRAAHYLAGGAMLRGRASRSTLSGRWCHAPGSRRPNKHRTLNQCCLMLDQRRKWWANLKAALIQCLVFDEDPKPRDKVSNYVQLHNSNHRGQVH